MKNSLLMIAVLCAGNLIFGLPALAAKDNTPGAGNSSPARMEADYTKAIEDRTASILKALALSDTNQVARVHDIIMAQWRALRAWHDANDAKLKQAVKAGDSNATAQIRTSLKSVHDRFLSELSRNLTPQQVDTVKDKMTYDKVEVTCKAYGQIVPNLTDADKAKILELLKQAREEAMDCGSAEEKSAVFKKYKGKINNYLNAQGHDVRKAYQEWGEKQKLKGPEVSAPASAR
ncbi:MAG TPA: DUF3826 domain-containing protein [Verrucomicrobiae bacterium]|nr:DUF3826 domain-containing protein [Verrucomicrobiae bacterium]